MRLLSLGELLLRLLLLLRQRHHLALIEVARWRLLEGPLHSGANKWLLVGVVPGVAVRRRRLCVCGRGRGFSGYIVARVDTAKRRDARVQLRVCRRGREDVVAEVLVVVVASAKTAATVGAAAADASASAAVRAAAVGTVGAAPIGAATVRAAVAAAAASSAAAAKRVGWVGVACCARN